MKHHRGWRGLTALATLALFATACGSSKSSSESQTATTAAESSATAGGASTATDAVTAVTEAAVPVTAASSGSGGAEEVRLAVNPWTGSAVNAAVAKAVIEKAGLGTVSVVELDENASWPAIASGDKVDGNLEVWPSGHAADYDQYIKANKGVVDGGLLGPEAKIGWYVPQFVIDEHPALKTWAGFEDPANASLFKTAESGDKGQFLMGDPSYVTYDEQIIANLKLPLKYVVAGSETSLITAIQNAEADHKPLLLQFWKPHWLQSRVKLAEVKLPDFTDACKASAAAADGKYACDYPIDKLYKVFNDKLATKAPKSFAVLQALTLTTDQQSEIAAMIDGDGMTADAAAAKWVAANESVWKAWVPAA